MDENSPPSVGIKGVVLCRDGDEGRGIARNIDVFREVLGLFVHLDCFDTRHGDLPIISTAMYVCVYVCVCLGMYACV